MRILFADKRHLDAQMNRPQLKKAGKRAYKDVALVYDKSQVDNMRIEQIIVTERHLTKLNQ